MNVTLVLVVALLVVQMKVEADFSYNRLSPKTEDLKSLGLKCIPGRTVIRIEEKRLLDPEPEEEEYVDEEDGRRSHMNYVSTEENCQICVCSVEGKDEYCSRRPAKNVNECLRMSTITENFGRHLPYSHERSLAFRIRRDYIWHDDEIPYEAKAKCRRSRSYYSNSINANNTDIDVQSDIDSLLDYSNKDVCFYCVCSVDGRGVGCIARDPVFCEYYRIIRHPEAARDRYKELFQQDRPAYFRQLSYRLRRMMDDGIFELMDNGGDTLCCDHPDGHRRNLHEHVRNKIRLMRRKVPKENILSGSPGVGEGLDDSKCIPFISEYSDCSDANACTGCNRCTCDVEGNWKCEQVFECPMIDDKETVDETTLEYALDSLLTNSERKKQKRGPGLLVPNPPKPDEDLLLVPAIKFDFGEELKSLFSRYKRSADKDKEKGTVKFYETIDEINEDTLKSTNDSGTLEARKIEIQNLGKLSRRAGISNHVNASDPKSLHIEYNQPHEFEHHVAENKVDSKHPLEENINGLSHEEIHKILGNYSLSVKDKDLSKLVVNELTHGTEVIGDKNVKPLSNITFTPENDTFTAMAFIAGNLLNKLWEMEKDATEGSFEAEEMKHKKINDLLQLFKEPLSLRQEIFIKNALEKLSQVIDTNKAIKNMSFCTNFEEVNNKNNSTDKNCTQKPTEHHTVKQSEKNQSKPKLEKQRKATTNALKKINDVLNLIKKYEVLQNSLNNLKNTQIKHLVKETSSQDMTLDENVSLNLFGNLLSKITNLLSPYNKNRSVNEKINSYKMLRQDDVAKKIIEKLFDIDLRNSSFNVKDKMIMDYLENIERHPNCFLSSLQKPIISPLPYIDGNILYNLSEFLKIKSFSDLLSLVKERPYKDNTLISTPPTTTNYPINTKRSTTSDMYLKTHLDNKPMKIDSVKEKLKNDLKTILQDLIDLQKEHSIKTKNGLNVADALPCIYNILNAENNPTNENPESKLYSPINKIKILIEALKQEMKSPLSRRSDVVEVRRPKSAVVWERAIKNLNKDSKQSTRRNLNQNQKSYKELKDMMDKVDLSSNSYKNIAIQFGVEPSDRLILLRTLQADVEQYKNVLENIKLSLKTVTNLPSDKQNEFKEFIDNAAININLNKKLLDVIEKLPSIEFIDSTLKPRVDTIKNPSKFKETMRVPNWKDLNDNHNLKLRREQIINQLIINRLNMYLKTKEQADVDFNEDINYNLAKRILYNIENGNIVLAKELFKVFIANKKPQQFFKTGYQNLGYEKENETRGLNFLAFREPLIRVEDPKKIKMLNQDYLFKQLMNLKDLREQR